MASVEEIIDDQRGFAAQVLSDSQQALRDVSNMITGIGYLQPDPQLDPIDQPLEPPVLQPVPEFAGVDFQLPQAPGAAPQFQDIGPIDISGLPVATAVVPTITMPSSPAPLADFSISAPSINTSYEFPDPPDQLINPLVAEPQIQDRAAPDKPTIVLPVFDSAAPVFDAEAPTDLAVQLETTQRGASAAMMSVLDGQLDAMLARYCPRYHSSMETMELRLSQLMAGGSGFSGDVERAVIERAKDRHLGEYRRVRDAAWADAADRGYTLPPGALLSAATKARQAAADNLARANVELVAKQAEMEQANLQFALSTSMNLRQSVLAAMLSYHGNLVQINGQALEHAKAVVGMAVEAYNIAVKAFGAKLEAWRAQVALYEVRLKGAMAAIDLYKAEVDALQALTQVDMAKVNVYRARMESLQSLANVYRARIDAIVSRAGLEKLKLELFQAQVQTRATEVQSKATEWTGYRAALEGQELQVRVYDAQVRADGQAIQTYRAGIDAKVEVVRAAAITNDSRARVHEMALREYGQIVAARGELARTQLEGDRQKLMAYQAQTAAAVSYAQMAATFYRSKADVNVSYADARMRAQTVQQSSMQSMQAAITQLAAANANTHSQVAGQAMAGLNSVAIKSSDG